MDSMDFYNDEEGVEIYESNENSKENTEEVEEEVTPNTLDVSDLDLDLSEMEVEQTSDTEDEGNIISPEEKVRIYSDKLVSSCIAGKELYKYATEKLMSISNPCLFRDENYILFSIFYQYRSKLKDISIDSEFIRLYLMRNRDIITKSRAYIDITAYGDVDGSVELGYISGVVKHFNRLKAMPDIPREEFETCLEKYLIEFKSIEANKVYRTAQQILTDGLKIGRKTYFGFNDSQNYCRKKLAEIEGVVDMSMGSGFTKLSELILSEKAKTHEHIKIGDFGRIEPLNKAYGGIYTGFFYSFVAPPKSGKTKLCARLCHNVMLAGNNITVWAQEGGNEAWEAQMRAIHFDYIYNTGVDVLEKKYGVCQDTIIKDSFETDELRQLEQSSKLDLASNEAYGSIDMIDRPFNVETFLDDIETSVKENNSKLVIVDYFQLIGSEKNITERERIAEAYKNMLKFCKKFNVAVIAPAQIKQDSFNALTNMKSVDGADLRTAAGGSSEVLRTPDMLFALWATVNDIRNNSMKIISMPSRMGIAFPNINLKIDLGTCQFISVD